ncbi:MAG: zf-HC2 domain-containing protein [Deltaproteobacteria bacterium]|nr:MAG: zf-HC2 domain-containing protein [Deltaproteobacteria bacterium]
MTHDELRAVLPPYAAGELEEEPAEVVRAHLATGCPDCLGALFRLPVGRPRSRWEAGLRRERRLAPATAVVLALALAALVGWTIRDLRQREAERRAESVRAAARLIEVETARAEAVARSDAFGRTLEAVRAEVAEARAAARGAAGERARLEAELAAAEARSGSLLRSIRRRDAEIDRLLGGAPERTLADLAAMPGFGVARLEPRTSDGARGHLLWHPARAAALLYAFGLPAAGRSYRVELELDDGRVQAGPAFAAGSDGEAILPIRLPVVGARLRGVTVVQDPGARPVLGARLGVQPAG